MKKILFAIFAIGSLSVNAQLNSASVVNNVPNKNTFLDASGFTGALPSTAKGLNYPRTNLTTFAFNTADLGGYQYSLTAFDGMVVYNTATGNTGSNAATQGQVTAVTPGFYYFSNPTATQDTNNVASGKWVRISGDAAAAMQNAWVLGGNSNALTSSSAIIGSTNSGAQNVRFFANNVERMTIGAQSGVTVDAANFDFVLDVLGKARFRNGIVTEKSTYPDYVFEKYFTGASKINPNYQFKSLAETEKFVKENNHLPGVTKITEFSKDGQKYLIDAAELSVQNLEKVEELYLHTIQQQKEIDALKAELAEIKASLKK